MKKLKITCHLRQLSPPPEKGQLSSRYLAWVFVGRIISGAAERKKLAHLAGAKGIFQGKN
jgi:hypothetical protein